MRLALKTQLKLNNKQRTMLAKSAGVARYTYNWGLRFCQNLLNHNQENPDLKVKFPSAYTLSKLFNASVKPDNPWIYEVTKCASQNALRHLREAFSSFYKKPDVGFPKFKKKGKDDSFTVEGSIEVGTNYVKIPRIGKVKVYETLAPYKPKSLTISKQADRWYVSYTYETESTPKVKPIKSVGVDLGIKSLVTLSTGVEVTGTKAYRLAERQLQRLQRRLSSKAQGSNNRQKARGKLAKAHAKVANIRKDTLHKLTTMICKNHEIIGIEDLNVSGMLSNHKLAKSIQDMGFYEFKRQLTYKSQKFGNQLVIIDRWFPSSKTCSHCYHVKADLTLGERTFQCENCGFILGRDLNASINIEQEALRILGI